MQQRPDRTIQTLSTPEQGAHPTDQRLSKMTVLHKLREVRVRMDFTRIIDINLQQQHFTASLRLESSWLDHSLAAFSRYGVDLGELYDDRTKGSRAEGYYCISDDSLRTCSRYLSAPEEEKEKLLKELTELADQTRFWYPRLKLTNLVGDSKEDIWWMKFYTSSGGPIACYRWDVTATFQELMELKLFPFDHQNLSVCLVSLWEISHPHTPVVLVKQQNEDFPSVCNNDDASFMQSSEYRLHDRVRFEQSITDPSRSSSRREYSMLRISCRVDRRAHYWILNVMFPLFIVTTSLFASFQVNYKDIGDRCSMNLTVLLALVAFKYVISDRLPNISYLTVIDAYLLACFAASFVVLVLQILSSMRLLHERLLIFDLDAETASGVADHADVDGSLVEVQSDGNSVLDGLAARVGGRVRARVENRYVEVNMNMIGLLLLWLLGHLVSIIWLASALRRQTLGHKFFLLPKNAVWISPLTFDIDAAAPDEIEITRQVVRRAIEARLYVGCVADIMLWTPEEAERTVRNDRGARNGGSDSGAAVDSGSGADRALPSMQNDGGHDKMPAPPRVLAKQKMSSIKSAIADSLKHKHLVEPGIELYKSTHSCVVVRFHKEEDAEAFTTLARLAAEADNPLNEHPLKSAIGDGLVATPKVVGETAGNGKDDLVPSLKVRLLNVAYHALAHRPTYVRGSALPDYDLQSGVGGNITAGAYQQMQK